MNFLRILTGVTPLWLLAAFTVNAAADTHLPLANPGFEQAADGWTIAEPATVMSKVDATAAHDGGLGLRIEDKDTVNGSSATSSSVPVVSGRQYRLSFWSRSLEASTSCGVYLRFRDSLGKQLPNAPTISLPKTEKTTWAKTELWAVAPTNAVTADIWIHSYGSTVGSWDVDDFVIEDMDAAKGAATTSKQPVATVAPTVASTVTAQLPSPLVAVVLKVDDLISTPTGGIPERWQRIANLALERKIKLSIGIIANSLEGDKPAYFAWIKDLQKTGLFEFWFHGYDHKAWQEGERKLSEFQGSTYEHQKDHFTRSQALAREKLGFVFTTFGAPFNVSDASTVRVLTEDTDMKVWLYGDRGNPAGKTILDRVGAVSIEQPLFIPNAAKFIEGYTRNATGRRVYVIQGHPAQWDDARWAQFVQIIDFLVQNKIPVTTPLEAANATR